jgi:hypothetical protein
MVTWYCFSFSHLLFLIFWLHERKTKKNKESKTNKAKRTIPGETLHPVHQRAEE